MTSDKNQFFILDKKKRRVVIFRDNGKEKIIGISKIKITPTFIDNILLADSLKHNLLNISHYKKKPHFL